ncbi:MAG: FAD-dependent oxidoreductase, partial [Candidatus Eremiobacteraeota bacterium]|nr:FAD-dependent oxidoreductase [Candidatus Eremiobacteraeota bacterium]
MAFERVAVVGGGLAGLSAALRLKECGLHVELFERSRLLGGRATSFDLGGTEVDNGQHVFLACCTEFIDFASRAGMAEKLRLQPRFDARIISRDGKSGRLSAGALPAPFHLTPTFARYPHLNVREKLNIARALSAVVRETAPIGVTVTFEEWLHRNHQGGAERRAFWDPFFIPALNAPFDRVSAEDALFVLRTAFLRDAAAARFGFSTVPLAHLAQAAAARLDAVHLSTPIFEISLQDDTVIPVGQGSFDAVVLAVPPRQAARLLADPKRYGVESLDDYEPYPIIDVHLWHDAGALGFDFAAALDSPLQWIFEKAPGYVCCSLSAAQEYLLLPTSELESFAWRETQTFLPQLGSARLTRSAVTRNPEATWLARLGAPRTAQRTNDPRIAIAGSWTDTGWPDTMESAVRSGTLAAEVLLHVQDEVSSPARTLVGPPPCGPPAAPLFRENEVLNIASCDARKSWSPRLENSPRPEAQPALKRAIEWLLREQNTEGWWSGELETNVTMTAEHVLLCRFLGIPTDGF